MNRTRLGHDVTIANTDQAAAWDGHEGDLWVEHADRFEAVGRRIWNVFLHEQPIVDGDRVLDIGCGTGKSTRDAARLTPSGGATGVDLSARMIEHARQRSAAEGLTNIEFHRADAQVHAFDEAAFDVAISSFGAMFFNDPVAAFANIGTALRPGGRLALLAWRELDRNPWLVVVRGALALGRELPQPPIGAPGPFGLADPADVRRVLGGAGFEDVGLAAVDEPVEFGSDADDAFGFVRDLGLVEGLTQGLAAADRTRALEALRGSLAAHATSEGVLLGPSAWLITARRP